MKKDLMLLPLTVVQTQRQKEKRKIPTFGSVSPGKRINSKPGTYASEKEPSQ
jgi:hypothetical protein